MCNQSQHSSSHHSSTGPSNNTGSTNLSQALLMQQQQRGGVSPYMHGQMVQMGAGPNGGQPHTVLLGPYGQPSMYSNAGLSQHGSSVSGVAHAHQNCQTNQMI
jgi:hypothetical protein